MVAPLALIAALSGAWSLLNTSAIYINGTQVPDLGGSNVLGKKPAGYLIYHPTGFVSANMHATEPGSRPYYLQLEQWENTTDAEWALLGKHNLAYYAPYTLEEFSNGNEEHGQLKHGPLLSCTMPSLENTTLVRNFTIVNEGKLLRLRTWDSVNQAWGTLWWGKIETLLPKYV
ncbi:hypothetical protein CC78DRAFT_527584 [Lojkania enalia]|uniref:Lipocalin-like domain-containing protein n=1 Tax=Lojkania enalia TaxID=147567 RepID=A0A9P4JVW9_9PLEO|nr:hypothetical protein CC78DRAFT_527584 [Didymosphaeria enalia]